MIDRRQTTDEEDWATIRELLKAGCSLPLWLQEKYDAHIRRVREAMFGVRMSEEVRERPVA